MAATASTRPPFRADHVGSLLRPKELREAFRKYGSGARSQPRVRRGPGARDPRRGQAAGGGRPAGRDRRRVPPQLLLGPVRRPLRGLRHQAGGLQVPRRSRPRGRLHGDLRQRQARAHPAAGDGRVRIPAQGDEGDGQDHHAGAIDHAFLSLHRFCRCVRLRRCARVLCRSRQDLPRGDRGSGEGRLPLRAARRGGRRHAVRSGHPRQGRGGGPGPRQAGRSLYRGDQRCRRRGAGRHADRHPHVPGQFPRPLSVGGRLRIGGRALLQEQQRHATSCSSTTPRAPATSSRCASCRRARAWCSGWSAPRRRCWRRSTISGAAPTRPRSSSTSTGSASDRNAGSPPPQPAIR